MAAWMGYAGLAALQLYTGTENAKMMQRSARMQERVANINAKYAEEDAYKVLKHGFEEVANYQIKVRDTLGAQRLAMAVNDVDPNFGTAAEIQAETKLTGFLNQVDIMANAQAKVLGLKREARMTRLGGAMARAQGEMNATATRTASFLRAGEMGVSGYAYQNSTPK